MYACVYIQYMTLRMCVCVCGERERERRDRDLLVLLISCELNSNVRDDANHICAISLKVALHTLLPPYQLQRRYDTLKFPVSLHRLHLRERERERERES